MKILFITSSYAIGDFRGGGITSYAAEVANLYRKSNDVSVIICNETQSTTEIPGIRTYHINPFSESYDSAVRLIDIIKEDNPEIIINSNVNLMSLVLPYISNKIKVVSICHSLGSLETETSGLNHEYVDGIVALSGYAQTHIKKRFRLSSIKKIPVIPNFVADYPNPEAVIQQKVNSDITKIMFFGGGTGTKSPDLIAKVLKELIKTKLKFQFYWVGETLPPFHRASLVKDIRQLVPFDDRVTFTGNLPHDDAQRLIADANVFLLPSRREGCPMALLEAMRTGAIPIVADYNIANKEIVSSGSNGFVINHKDVKKWVETLTEMIINKDGYHHMYWNSYNYFCDNLSYGVWQNNMNQLLQIPSEHKDRDVSITPREFNSQCKRLHFLLKLRRLQNFFKETFPAYISMNAQYLKEHYTID